MKDTKMINIENDLRDDLPLSAYEEASGEFINLCEESGISKSNIAFFGGINNPGISDLDLLVVSSIKNLELLDSKFNQLCLTSPNFKYIFWHSPVYLLETCANYSKYLHSLVSLTPVAENSFLSRMNFGISVRDRDILNIYWFCFLLIVFSKVLSKKIKGKPISLRLILLIYKNLFYSYKLFSYQIEKVPFLSSDEIRDYVLRNNTKMDKAFIWDNLRKLFEETCKNFDMFCAREYPKMGNIGRQRILISAGVIYFLSEKTMITCGKFLRKVFINPVAYSMLRDYLYRGSFPLKESKYIESAVNVEEIYSNVNLKYPFIRPIPETEFKILDKSLIFLNKLLGL